MVDTTRRSKLIFPSERTDPRPRPTATDNMFRELVKFGRVVFEIFERMLCVRTRAQKAHEREQ